MGTCFFEPETYRTPHYTHDLADAMELTHRYMVLSPDSRQSPPERNSG